MWRINLVEAEKLGVGDKVLSVGSAGGIVSISRVEYVKLGKKDIAEMPDNLVQVRIDIPRLEVLSKCELVPVVVEEENSGR
jgi:hypothetical protein